MGAGIVQVAAAAGFKVTMVDVNQEALDKGRQIILSSLQRIAKKKFEGQDAAVAQKFVSGVMDNVCTGLDSTVAAAKSDLIVEAIVENLAVKQKLFKALDAAAPAHAIFASNTSSLPIRSIAEATKRKDRFAGLHFFNPGLFFDKHS